MKRIFEWFGGFALIAFSFYFTDQVSILVSNKSDLMKEIKSVSKNYHVDAIEAVIDVKENTIIPGKNGRNVNDRDSYLSMQEFGVFNENYLVFDVIKPKKTLKDNKDKFITRGNTANRKVSIILTPNETIEKYLNIEKIPYDLIIDKKTEYKDEVEYINGASDTDNFKLLNTSIKNNQNICVYDYSDINMCKKYKYFIIKPTIKLNGTNIAESKNQITNGVIILISNSVKLEHLKLLINEIRYKDLQIVQISELINEDS